MPFEIDEIVLRVVRLPLKEPFVVSFGTVQERDQILLELKGGGISGWGESAVLPFPFYNHETPQTALHVLRDFVIPLFFAEQPTSPEQAAQLFSRIQGHRIARSGVEMAYWDWFAQSQGQPLYRILGGTRTEIGVGISIGLYPEIGQLLDVVGQFIERRYHRIKVKIGPGRDFEVIEAIRKRYGNIPLMADANSAYRQRDFPLLEAFDVFELMMIEQPLRAKDIYVHSKLQRQLKTSLCLDESIEDADDADAAIALGSCRVINIKPGRVGGLSESLAIHDRAQKSDIGVWCGGMLETGIGRAANLAVATLPNYRYPGDIAESARYYHEDIVEPEIRLSPQGTLRVLDRPGIGFHVARDRLDKFTKHQEIFRPSA